MAGIAASCCKLTKLKIKNSEHITDESLCAVFQACQHLTLVSLEKCSLITDRALTTLVQCRAGLKFLMLSDNTLLTERFVAASLAVPSLELLSITRMPVTDDSMVLLSQHCARLTSVYFTDCDLLTIRTFKSFIDNCNNLHILAVHSTQVKRTQEMEEYLQSSDIKKKLNDGLCIYFDLYYFSKHSWGGY